MLRRFLYKNFSTGKTSGEAKKRWPKYLIDINNTNKQIDIDCDFFIINITAKENHMKTIVVIVGAIFTLLATQANAIEQIKYNQTKSDQFGKDSTDLIPFDGLLLAPQIVNTAITNLTNPASITYGGQCGASNNSYLPSTPDRFLCESGAASTVNTVADSTIIGGEKYSWTCTGTAPNSGVSCSASKKVIGSCGTANGMALSKQPSSSEMCAAGKPTGYQQSGNTATWSCDGTPYQTSASCSATIVPKTTLSYCLKPAPSATPPTNVCNKAAWDIGVGYYPVLYGTVENDPTNLNGAWKWQCRLEYYNMAGNPTGFVVNGPDGKPLPPQQCWSLRTLK